LLFLGSLGFESELTSIGREIAAPDAGDSLSQDCGRIRIGRICRELKLEL